MLFNGSNRGTSHFSRRILRLFHSSLLSSLLFFFRECANELFLTFALVRLAFFVSLGLQHVLETRELRSACIFNGEKKNELEKQRQCLK